MNEGRYPDKVINEGIRLLQKGMHPKDAADVLREEYGYETLHPKTIARWRREHPLGKGTTRLSPGVEAQIRDVARDEAERREAERERVRQMKAHQDTLMPTILDLRGIEPFALHHYDLAIWYSRPDEPCWPIAKGQVCREQDGTLTVSLEAEGKLEWTYLRQHLPDDPLWKAVETAKRSLAEDLSARLRLLDAIARRIEEGPEKGGLGLPVGDDLGFNKVIRSEVTTYYVFTIHDQVLVRTLGLRRGGIHREGFGYSGPGSPSVVYLGGPPVIRSEDPETRSRAIDFLLMAQQQLVSLEEAQAAANAYRKAEANVKDVNQHLERIRLTPGFPPGSSCECCRAVASDAP